MQTPILFPSSIGTFKDAAVVFDMDTLDKQTHAVFDLIAALKLSENITSPQPIFRMWRGYSDELESYLFALWFVYDARSDHTKKHPTYYRWWDNPRCWGVNFNAVNKMPYAWFTRAGYVAWSRSALLRENYIYYSRFSWDVDLDLPQYWPEDLSV